MTQLLKANATRPISRLMLVDAKVRGTPRDSHDAVRRSHGPPRSKRTRGGVCKALQQLLGQRCRTRVLPQNVPPSL